MKNKKLVGVGAISKVLAILGFRSVLDLDGICCILFTLTCRVQSLIGRVISEPTTVSPARYKISMV